VRRALLVLVVVVAVACSSSSSTTGYRAVDGSTVHISNADLATYCAAMLSITTTSDAAQSAAAATVAANDLDRLAARTGDADTARRIAAVRDGMNALVRAIGAGAAGQQLIDVLTPSLDAMPPCGGAGSP
jgi:hypothetical protein